MSEPSRPKKQTCLYISPSVLKEFIKLCRIEGSSASQKVEAFMVRYNEMHRKPNPQLLMEYYVKPENLSPCVSSAPTVKEP